MHGDAISPESELGASTTLTINLPIKQCFCAI
jgi:hypothetical protein